jgi:ECF transporter S component (folate family)
MKTKKTKKQSHQRLRVLIFSSILCALSVILSQYLSIKIGTSIRIGFGSVPVIMAGLLFGPMMGAAVGAVSDIVGCAMYYGLGSMIPLVTVGMMAEGFLAGLFYRKKTKLRIAAATVLSRLVGSLILRSLGLYLHFHTPLAELLTRIPCVMIEAVLTVLLLGYLFCGNPTLQKVMKGWEKQDDDL